MADFLMPALGADMETGKLVQWLVAPGSRVKPGDVVAVVETHKGAIDVEIFLDGVIGDLAPLGVELPVGAVLARVQGEAADAAAGRATAPASLSLVAASPAPAATAASAPHGVPALHGVAAPAAPAAPGPARVRASPAARRRAQELGLDIDRLQGTGVDGAVTLGDVDRALLQPGPPALTAAAPAAPPIVPRRGFDPAQMRQAIAVAMSRSKREIPHYYLWSTLDFGSAARWLEDYNRERSPDERLLPAALLLKAAARALAERPQLNGFLVDGAFRGGSGIHVGWAIALRGGGLVAPAIHDADRRSLPELMAALRDLVQRARAGGLRSSEMTDPTVTVTSVGDRGADGVLGVIHPPQVAMIGFGRVVERPWVVDGRVVARPLVQASLAGDHRASDGHLGGLLLDAIDRALQAPHAL